MADSRVAPALLARTDGDWSIFKDLEDLDEPHRRLILRSHREVPFDASQGPSVSGYRLRLDHALDRVMLRELGLETGLLTDVQVVAGIPHMRDLFKSGAFARYVDAYLALSMRFVAERLGFSDPARKTVNELPVARPCPPPLLSANAADAPPAMERLLTLEAKLDADVDVVTAMRFLDGFVAYRTEYAHYELWLRRLNGTTDDDARFTQITRGLIKFAEQKTQFYRELEGDRIAAWEQEPVAGTWSARNPITARFGVYDLYRVARLLRAEVSPTGEVTYADGSWLKLLRTRGPEVIPASASGLATWDEVLHGVLDYACDLVQNSADIASDRVEADESTPIVRPKTTVAWRTMYDEELAEVTHQRNERQYDHVQILSAEDPTGALREAARGDRDSKTGDAPPQPEDFRRTPTWSRRVCTGEHVDDLVGLAISGGGIRSATFGLGVLQRLQEIELLRKVDYLSTVSGGGYIGAWLVASVRRTRYWLTQPTEWERSIDHLRRYSNYLSPHRGLMSADTWTMWGSWIRNALLIQSSALIWLAWVMLIVGLGKFAFDQPSAPGTYAAMITTYKWIVSGAVVTLAALIYRNIASEKAGIKDHWVLYLIVLPAWGGSFFASALLWLTRPLSSPPYSEILILGLREWLMPLLLFIASVWALAWRSSTGRLVVRALLVTLATACSAAVTYLAVCGMFWLYGQWSREAAHFVWYAYSIGPSLMLLSVTSGVVTMIGVLGHSSPDWRREWWTRLGSWLGIYGVIFLAATLGTILGPLAMLSAVDASHGRTIPWGTVLAWIGTVVGGLFAGNSARPEAERAGDLKAKAIAVFARFAALAFIVGSVFLVATVVHVLLAKIWACTDVLYTRNCYEVTAGNYWRNLSVVRPGQYMLSAAVVLLLGIISSMRFELNVFGLNQFYRNRLVRCYLGATRWAPGLRTPHPFTAFDGGDDLPLADLRYNGNDPTPYRGPFPIVNCALNLGGSSDLILHTRHSAPFVMTPLRCGSDRDLVGYAPASTEKDGAFGGLVNLGQAISVSGAAASPNMGYDTSPLVAFLLTMFNVRLGWWFPNPGKRLWSANWLPFSLLYLVRETFGLADEKSYFVNVSDGGHFENLGIYELVRRRCRVIIASDAECDDQLAFGSLGRVVRMCETDFGAKIDIDVESIRRKPPADSRAHCAVGRITYANGSRGYLIYLKASVTGDEEVDIQQYRAAHPRFPHEPTADQFFAEDQFESYRQLGYHIATMTFRGAEGEKNIIKMADKLANLWIPASAANAHFVPQTEALLKLWDQMRHSPELLALFGELHATGGSVTPHQPSEEELCMCLQLIQQMENAFLDLRLDEFWEHPDNRGWVVLFTMWAQSPTFRNAWRQYRDVFGVRFGLFCNQRLGM